MKYHCGDSNEESISNEEFTAPSGFSGTSCVSKGESSKYDPKESEKENDACTWNAVFEEANNLICLNKRAYGSSSNVSKSRKIHGGARSKDKLALSHISSLQKDDLFCSFAAQAEIETEDLCSPTEVDIDFENPKYMTVGNSISEQLDDLRHAGEGDPAKFSFLAPGIVASVSELLEDLQEKKGYSSSPFNMTLETKKAKARKDQSADKRTMHVLGSRTLDDKDPPDFVSDGQSSDDEAIYLNDVGLASRSRQTMSELLLEAFNTDVFDKHTSGTNKLGGNGYHARLQQVIRLEKEHGTEFLKQMHLGNNNYYGESKCMVVQLLSRILESKLTVCHCRLSGIPEEADDLGAVKTVIFNPKICDNVDLDVGDFIRIFWPWKEVAVSADEKIVLCTYFARAAS